MRATKRQLNSVAANLVHNEVGPPEEAAELAYRMLEAAGYDMTTLDEQTDQADATN